MAFEDFISETEAALRAGVSVKTLQRFSEAGYLQLKTGQDGQRLYSQRELNDIFGAHQDASRESSSPAEPASSCSATVQEHEKTEAASESVNETIASQEPTQVRATTAAASDNTESSELADETEPSMYAIEIVKLRNVISLQERLLDTKDAEIADLKNQREWLRARVEKLEEKSDRDQILLLSETQTIRKLISLQEQKRSGFRQFLEWMGLAPQPQVKALATQGEFANSDTVSSSARTIEVKEAANG